MHTLRLTLTYGKDDRYKVDLPGAHVLTYSDVQLYLKRLRLATPGRVRFLCTGEYGSQKGRAHWHLIVFFKDCLCPNLLLQERYIHSDGHNPLWEHGFSYWESLDDLEEMSLAAAVRYVTKYILKDLGEGFRAEHRFSTKPPLGWAYFDWLAAEYVRQGLSPQDLFYVFPGDPTRYRLSRASAYYFLESFVRWWELAHGSQRAPYDRARSPLDPQGPSPNAPIGASSKAHDWPQSDLLDEFMDERARRRRRRAGVADYDEGEFDRRMDLYRQERRGEWLGGLGGGDQAVAARGRMFHPPSADTLNRYGARSRGE